MTRKTSSILEPPCFFDQNQVALLRVSIQRHMQEAAEETSATTAMESLGMTTELAKREARITQLGSRIEDLQVQRSM